MVGQHKSTDSVRRLNVRRLPRQCNLDENKVFPITFLLSTMLPTYLSLTLSFMISCSYRVYTFFPPPSLSCSPLSSLHILIFYVPPSPTSFHTTILVSSPDLIRCVYRFPYNARAILKAIRAGVGFGSGTETTTILTYTNVRTFLSPLLPSSS